MRQWDLCYDSYSLISSRKLTFVMGTKRSGGGACVRVCVYISTYIYTLCVCARACALRQKHKKTGHIIKHKGGSSYIR